MNLNIVQFTWGLKIAGLERVVVDLAKGFHEIGHKSMVYTTLKEGDLVHELRQVGINCKCFGLKKSYNFFGLVPIVSDLKSNRINVIITHGTSGSWVPRIAAILARIPVFIHVEHSTSNNKRFYHIILNRILSKFTHRIVCVSESARQSLLEIEKIKPNRVSVIHNGLHTGRFAFVKDKQKSNSRLKKIGIVGRFDVLKGHLYFIEAAAKVIKSFKDIEFVFIGDGPLKTMIEQRVKELGLDEYSRFLGLRSDVGELLQTLDVFVLSSIQEGLPISLLEAQYFGVAAVVTAVGGIPEIIKDKYNGLLVPPKNPERLATAILSVLNDEKLRSKLAVNAKKGFINRFSIENTVKNYLNVISDIFNQETKKSYIIRQSN